MALGGRSEFIGKMRKMRMGKKIRWMKDDENLREKEEDRIKRGGKWGERWRKGTWKREGKEEKYICIWTNFCPMRVVNYVQSVLGISFPNFPF